MESQLAGNPQLDLGPVVKKYFPFDKLRSALNTVNLVLDEDTQRGTDRLVRNVIQDLEEV